MTYDFNIKVKELDGSEGRRNLAIILAEYLGTETEVAALKFFGWYNDLRNEKPLELDEADRKSLYDYVDGNKRIMVFMKGQFLNILK